MNSNSQNESGRPGFLILLAGIGGGLAEILWVMVYRAFTPASGMEVARAVTASLFPRLAAGASGFWLGIAIHMALATALGYAFAHAIWKPWARARGPLATLAAAALVLATIWTLNFFVVLPALNPAFIALMPYSVSFASKMLFAVAMGGVLAGASREVAAGEVSRHASG